MIRLNVRRPRLIPVSPTLASVRRALLAWAHIAAVLALAAGCSSRPTGWSHHAVAWINPVPPVGPATHHTTVVRAGIELKEVWRGAARSTGFTEAIASINATSPGPFAIEVRARPEPGEWTPWLTIAEWGLPVDRALPIRDDADRARLGARVAIDELLLLHPADHIDARVVAHAHVEIHRVDLVLTTPDPQPDLRPSAGPPIDARQAWANAPHPPARTPAHTPNAIAPEPLPEELRGRLCSPTSLGMLLEFHGVRDDPQRVRDAVHDPRHDLFGVWPRQIQAAWGFGVPARLARFGHWRAVREHLQTHGPIAVSITASADEAPWLGYDASEGHILVLIGLTARGDAIVLDPAHADREPRVYPARGLTEGWLRRKRGTAYVLIGPPARPPQSVTTGQVASFDQSPKLR